MLRVEAPSFLLPLNYSEIWCAALLYAPVTILENMIMFSLLLGTL